MTRTRCFLSFNIIFVNLYRKRDSAKSLWQILQLHWEFKQDRTRYSNTSKNDFLVILRRIFFHAYIYIYMYIGISCTFIRAETKERKKGYKFMPHCRKQETSDLPPSRRLNFLRTSHISNWCDLHTFYSFYPARTSGTTRMGWINGKTLRN